MLHLKPPLMPMEAESVDEPPVGEQWQYEPKWDGFRCLAFRDGDKVYLQSKSGRPLARYFPDLVDALKSVGAKKFVLDGEIVIPLRGRLSFDELLMRIHPAETRVRKLADAHPATYVVFDLLLGERGQLLLKTTLAKRRIRLEAFANRYLQDIPQVKLSPRSDDLKVAKGWLRATGGNLDGIIAKQTDLDYRSGIRDGMQKIKRRRTVDCVVGGFRYAEGKKVVGSLLLGLFDDDGLLHHVGFTSSFNKEKRAKIAKRVEPLIAEPGFTGQAPGGPSRWSTKRSTEWQPLRTKLVVEVSYDHFTGGRFRHGTQFLRWRPDKKPASCTMGQVTRKAGASLNFLK
jgi:ATP-dependent DNA ligase